MSRDTRSPGDAGAGPGALLAEAAGSWPRVPAVYGWLRLNRRGDWLLRGGRVTNARLADHLSRHYACDGGDWCVVNGPQRVYADLDYTPLVVRLLDDELVAHTGAFFEAHEAWLDEQGALLFSGALGVALLDDRDSADAAHRFVDGAGTLLDEDLVAARLEALQGGVDDERLLSFRLGDRLLCVRFVHSEAVPERFGYRREPRPPAPAPGERAGGATGDPGDSPG